MPVDTSQKLCYNNFTLFKELNFIHMIGECL